MRTDTELLDFLLKHRGQTREELCREIEAEYDPAFGDERICRCGHAYYRHYDTYDQMRNVGCKYCDCTDFVEDVSVKGHAKNCRHPEAKCDGGIIP